MMLQAAGFAALLGGDEESPMSLPKDTTTPKRPVAATTTAPKLKVAATKPTKKK